MVTPGRFELPTCGLGNRCSIHLSYGANLESIAYSHLHAAELTLIHFVQNGHVLAGTIHKRGERK